MRQSYPLRGQYYLHKNGPCCYSFSQFAGGEACDAQTLTVTSSADAGQGSLRQAIDNAQAGDVNSKRE